ncbi:MAG: hypothetical protein KAJ90_00470 [Desulfobacterales bacterium]|nr:hypothetical protein [Desulfobacterales bacterium]
MHKLIILFCFVVLVVCAVVAHAKLTTVQQGHTFTYGGIAEGVTRPAFVIVQRIKNRALIRAFPEPEPKTDAKATTNKATKIYFAINSSRLTQTAKLTLDSIDKNTPVSVTGFACPLGPPAWNKRLAQLRAYKAARPAPSRRADHYRTRKGGILFKRFRYIKESKSTDQVGEPGNQESQKQKT